MCCSRLPLDSPVTASPEISRNSSSSSNKRLQFETFPEGSRNDFSARCLRIMTHSSSWWSESCNLRSLGLQQRKKLERLTAWKIYTHFIYTYICILETYFKHLQTSSNHSRTFTPTETCVLCQQKTGAVPVFKLTRVQFLNFTPHPRQSHDLTLHDVHVHDCIPHWLNIHCKGCQKRPQEVVSWGQLKPSCKQ